MGGGGGALGGVIGCDYNYNPCVRIARPVVFDGTSPGTRIEIGFCRDENHPAKSVLRASINYMALTLGLNALAGTCAGLVAADSCVGTMGNAEPVVAAVSMLASGYSYKKALNGIDKNPALSHLRDSFHACALFVLGVGSIVGLMTKAVLDVVDVSFNPGTLKLSVLRGGILATTAIVTGLAARVRYNNRQRSSSPQLT